MSLQIRRGTNAERLTITPQVGELIYVTDHTSENVAPLWVGDGLTVGGKSATTEIEGVLGDLDNVDLSGLLDGDFLQYDALSTTWKPVSISGDGNVIEGTNYRINIAADDSTILVDTRTNEFNGTLNGDVFGTVFGSVEGDVKGSVFNDDSTPIVDAVNRIIYGSEFKDYTGKTWYSSDDRSLFDVNHITMRGGPSIDSTITDLKTIVPLNNNLFVAGQVANPARLHLFIEDTTTTIADTTSPGRLLWTREDQNGSYTMAMVAANANELFLGMNNGSGGYAGSRILPGGTVKADSGFLGDTLTLNPLSSAPTSPSAGMIAVDDGTDWSGVAGGVESVVAYVNGAWAKIA